MLFDHKSIGELGEYEPFHSELNLSTRVTSPVSSHLPQDPADCDPYIVERIEKKRFNSHKVQYEYYVKWLGYVSAENTWEIFLPTFSMRMSSRFLTFMQLLSPEELD